MTIAYDKSLDGLSRQQFEIEFKRARGLEKLRFIADAGYRQELEKLYWVAHKNDRDPESRAQHQRYLLDQERDDLLRIVERALAGKKGKRAKSLAERVLAIDPRTQQRPRDLQSLRLCVRALDELNHGPQPNGGFQTSLDLPAQSGSDDIHDGFQSSLEPSS